MRVHERLGARVSTPLPRSLRITGAVGEWESWTAMSFPETGDYVFPEGLAPVSVDRETVPRFVLGAECVDGAPGPKAVATSVRVLGSARASRQRTTRLIDTAWGFTCSPRASKSRWSRARRSFRISYAIGIMGQREDGQRARVEPATQDSDVITSRGVSSRIPARPHLSSRAVRRRRPMDPDRLSRCRVRGHASPKEASRIVRQESGACAPHMTWTLVTTMEMGRCSCTCRSTALISLGLPPVATVRCGARSGYSPPYGG